MSIYVGRKYALMPQPMEGGVETTDAAEQVDKAHEQHLSDDGY
jgi:hypothetical protein